MIEFKNIPHKLKISKRYYSLSVVIKEDQDLQLYGLKIVSNPDGEFFVEDSFGPLLLEEFLTSNTIIPVLLNIEGATIVSKDTVYEEGYLKSLLFRTNLEELYINETVIDGNVFVSYSRRSIIDPILDAFAKADFHVIRLSLGPFIVASSIPYLPENTAHIQTSNYTVEIRDNKLNTYKKSSPDPASTITILNEQFSEAHTTALSLFLSEKLELPLLEGASKRLKINREESLYKTVFKKAGLAILVLILASIVVGHFVKKRKTQTFIAKQSEISFLQQTQTMIKTLEEEKANKEFILSNSGFNRNAIFTKYASDITNSVPETIVIDLLNLQPLDQKIKVDQKIEIAFNLIEIEGVSQTDNDVDQWIDELKKINWINRIEVIDYKRDLSGNGIFTILIEVN